MTAFCAEASFRKSDRPAPAAEGITPSSPCPAGNDIEVGRLEMQTGTGPHAAGSRTTLTRGLSRRVLREPSARWIPVEAARRPHVVAHVIEVRARVVLVARRVTVRNADGSPCTDTILVGRAIDFSEDALGERQARGPIIAGQKKIADAETGPSRPAGGHRVQNGRTGITAFTLGNSSG